MPNPGEEPNNIDPGTDEILPLEVEDLEQELLPGDEEQDDTGAPVTVERRLETALQEADKFRDMALRAEAEMQNVRRRAERDVENAHKYGIEKFVANLLPVLDGIEKAVESSEAVAGKDADDPVLVGIRLCHKLLLDVLVKENIEVIDPVGQPFDPNEHQAMSMIENPDMEPNSVCAVVQRGYKLNARLVRPAMVMVSKAPGD